MKLEAELWSGNCKIPNQFRLYHGGEEVDGKLKTQPNKTWGKISNHVFFSLDMSYVQEYYLLDWSRDNPSLEEDEGEFRSASKSLYVLDARVLLSNSLVLSNIQGVWSFEVCRLEDLLDGFSEHQVDNINALQQLDSEFIDEEMERFRKKYPKIITKEHAEKRLPEARTEWVYKYCKPFNLNHMARYRKQYRNIVLVPGPVPVK